MRHARAALLALAAACGGGTDTPVGSPDAAPTCTPRTCAGLGADCDEVSEGCGATLSCGACAGPLTCGGGGVANVCGAPAAIAIDVTTVHVSGVVTANGAVPDQSCTGTEVRGRVLFSEEQGPASFSFPIPCGPAGEPFAYSGIVYPSVYRVQVVGDASSLPSTSVTVATGLEVRADRTDLAWDVTNRHVGGTLTQNGQVPAQTCVAGGNRAQVLFLETSLGSQFSFPIPCDPPGTPFSFGGTVPPGTYKVSVLGENSSIPTSLHVMQDALVVQSDVDALAYDLVTHPVSGVVTLNGDVPGQDPTCRTRRGVVIFESLAGSFSLPIPCAAPGTPFTFAGEMYAGNHIVKVAGTGSELPKQFYRFGPVVDVAAPVTGLAIDVATVTVSGSVTVNGQVPAPCTGATWGELTAEEPANGYRFSIDVPCGSGGPFAFSATLYPGSYQVYATINGGESFLLARALDVQTPVAGLVLDATSVEHPVSGVVTLNGATPGSACTPPELRGRVELDDLVAGTHVSLSLPCDGSEFRFTGVVPPGTYRVTIFGLASDLPGPVFTVPEPLVVAAPVSDLRYDVPARHVTGTITLDGGTPVCAPGATAATVQLTATGFTFALSAVCGAAGEALRFGGDVYPGTYDVVVYGKQSDLPPAGYRAPALVVP